MAKRIRWIEKGVTLKIILHRRLKEKWRGRCVSNLKSHEAENQVEKDFEVGAFAGSGGRLSGRAIQMLVLGDGVVDGLLAAEEAEPDERGQTRLRAVVQVASLLDIVENLEKEKKICKKLIKVFFAHLSL
jgi:hypothetical protein